MYILNYILLIAGILFAIAMFLICFGMFHTPRPKQNSDDEVYEYYNQTSRSGRHMIDASDDIADDEPESADEPESTEDVDAEAVDAPDNDDSTENETVTEDENDPSDDEDIDAKPDNLTDKEESPKPAKPVREIKICVTIIDTNKKKTIAVEDEIIIGRSPKCDVVINKPMVSAAHCILTRDGKKLMAEDNNSTNGTMLNGKPLNHVVELKNNDVLTLGDKSIRINFI